MYNKWTTVSIVCVLLYMSFTDHYLLRVALQSNIEGGQHSHATTSKVKT